MTFRRFMGFTAMAFLWTGSQIPVYLFGKIPLRSTHPRQWLTQSQTGGIPPYIYGDIGGADRWIWFVSISSRRNTISRTNINGTIGSCEPARSRRCLSIRRISVGLDRSSLCRHYWGLPHLHRHDCEQHREYDEHLHRLVDLP